MELAEFLDAIARSPVLDTVRLERYRAVAADLSPERRAEIVAILRRHETGFVRAVHARDDERVALAHRSAAADRASASRELADARTRLDVELEASLADI